jgi:hypothetical protein
MRQPSITWGSPFSRRMSRPTGFVIRSLEELDQHLEAANTPGNELAVARMCAYIREAQNVPKETHSPVQCEALTRWKIPTWVPAEARPTQRMGDPNAPAGVNTPQLADPPEWARWLWRYPREAETRLGIRRGREGISLRSVRGMLVTGCAPRGPGVANTRHAFMLRAAQLLATPGLYRRMVTELRLTIATTSRVTSASQSENIAVEDVVRMLAADGVTIAQVRDTHEWAQSMLRTMSNGVDASRQTEAMMALAEVQHRTSNDEQDQPQALEPRWWYPPTEVTRRGRASRRGVLSTYDNASTTSDAGAFCPSADIANGSSTGQ